MRRKNLLLALFLGTAGLMLGGCSRSVLNYQVAECIGTLDKYENNEPVETPKMKAERERKESEAALETERTSVLEEAEALALAYEYEQAIAYLQNAESLKDDDRAIQEIAKYQSELDSMYEYDGDIGHLSFSNLVADTSLAFDNDEYYAVYRDNMITIDEFRGILNTLYESGYMLIDIHELANQTEDSNGDASLTARRPVIPEGRKPFILSIDNLDYSSVRNGDGVATRLAFDADGNVGAVLADADGHESIGAYDVIPVIEEFIAEHPDFSFRGARGIIGVAGQNGAFGYAIEEGSSVDYESNAATVKEIAAKLASDGWCFATMGYGYQKLGELSYDGLRDDITKWKTTVGNLIGSCDILMYPYGSEVDYATEKAAYITGQGYCYLLGLWPGGDHVEVNPTYLRQTRRMVNGYMFSNYPDNYSPYFSVSAVIDDAR